MNEKDITFRKIEALQLHYTSCRHGLSGHAGFQTRAISEGITPEEQRAMERIGIYEPPRDLPLEPAPNDILENFPKAFRSLFLETKRLAVIRSVYVGQDYTGRWGNYFSHGLVLNNFPNDLWPIDFYEWSGWKEKISQDEDSSETSFQLQPANLQPDESAYSFTELQEFLKEDTNRTNHLANMIRAILMQRETSRSLVIREELENTGLFWIACIQKSFSPAHQKELSCSSYQFDPRACLALNVTQGETDFILGESERQYQFYVFDFIDNQFSDTKKQPGDYANIVSTWMAEQPETLNKFHRFCGLFNHDDLNDGLLSILCLFQLSIGEKTKLDEDELVNVLRFVNSQAKESAFEKVFDVLSSVAKFLVESEDSTSMVHLARFFLKSAYATKNSKYRESAYLLMIRMLDKIMFQHNGSIDEVIKLRAEAKQAFESFEIEFAELFLSKEHLSKINKNINMMSDKMLSVAMRELVFAVHASEKNKVVYEDENIQEFIKNTVLAKVPKLSRLGWLFELFVDDPRKVAGIYAYITQILEHDISDDYTIDESTKALAELLSEILAKTSSEYRFKLINEMKSCPASWPLLRKEWKNNIRGRRNKIAAHSEYQQRILNDHSEYAKQYSPDLAEELWEILSEKERPDQAISWIQGQETLCFSPAFVRSIFQMASKKVSFNPRDSESSKLAELLADWLPKFDIILRPNRLKLRNAVTMVSEKVAFKDHPLSEISQILAEADKKTYEEFIMIYLPIVLNLPDHYLQHGKIIKHTLIPIHLNIFKKAYKLFFKQGLSDCFDIPSWAALNFWLFLKSNDKEYEISTFLREDATEFLALRISKLKDNSYSKLLKNLDNNPEITHSVKKKWNVIRQITEEKRNTILRSIWQKFRKASSAVSIGRGKKNG